MAALTTTLLATSVALTAAGVGTSVYGAAQRSEAEQNIAAQQMRAEGVRKQAAELDARRRTLEIVRNQQRARSLGLVRATGQNAQLGTGLQGGYGQIAGQTGTNLLGVSQNLQLGNQLFDINAQISQQRMAIASAGTVSAIGQGMSSLGGSLMTALPQIKSLSGGFNSPTYDPWAGMRVGEYG